MEASPTIPGWPTGVREIAIRSSFDGSDQPALIYNPATSESRPLLVALHTWSFDYLQPESAPYAEWCLEHGWHLIHPDFRGPNQRPEAGGSPQALQDILDAVAYCRANANVDPRRIYLAGVSGGGYASLLIARTAPSIWAGVSTWVPISDVRAWWFESAERELEYHDDVLHMCGGAPGDSEEVDRQYALRSVLPGFEAAAIVPLDMNAGIHDGHTGSVPVNHTLWAFNAVAAPEDRISDAAIDAIVTKEEIPAELGGPEPDPLYGENPVLFRRQSRRARVTIFEGGHEILFGAALAWLAGQRR